MKSLAAIPLLLQIMALLWKEHEYLPDSRLTLYDAALNYLLDYRDRKRKIKPPLLSAENARRVLGPVSLWMQEEVKKDEVNRDEMHSKMEDILRTLDKPIRASDFCQNLVERAGVLVEYGENDYLFRHKSFREYLAGVQLSRNLYQSADYLDNLVFHFGDDWWSEVFRFFIAQLNDAVLFERFMVKLFEAPVTESLDPKQQALLLTLVREAPQKQYGELMTKLPDTALSTNRQRYLAECLRTIGREDALDAVRRFEAKGTSGLFINSRESDAHYLLIRGGTFTYSVTKKRVTLPEFRLARYPVTNRQYRRFIDYLRTGRLDGAEVMPLAQFREALAAFAQKEWLEWLVETARGNTDLAGAFRSGSDDDKRFNGEEQPVVDVHWYAARSYCLWLSLLESGGNDTALCRLPTETEWEYAASGAEGHLYPWGNAEPTPKRANYGRNENRTTPVGSYPAGATPEGVLDMAGNVWEWQENLFDNKKYPGARALRGGSWLSGTGSLRCSSRGDYCGPDGGNVNIGFRVLRPSPLLKP
jgi:formylglycine-generating enzyme required for sulfatase activity